MEMSTRLALDEAYPDVVVHQLGLSINKDTTMGNAILRGVSGGERKRVTIGDMEFGMKQVSLMEGSRRGWPAPPYSASSRARKTIVIALLQPSLEVVDLFDDVLVMRQRHLMYHGPSNHVLAYFESLGFVYPKGNVTDI
ncbi:hypothetical protein DYB25_012114 [Aphanomyces astaci]|uniref:ABC transporter domain-containing protein n=1 Tax=Aphanomyces astaci TaxID=112090 RepID=A0A397FDS3_APHAT|nr:hypothetical protein DYB36_008634 [Aphanomyces astaci]RHY12495.1 hypothetical protein DYB25_012114 [Aphanomyces astaci]RHY63008.1 hypothetical protein DYB34_009058 [Aphanomyces astaci]RHY69199.1 hypothetical protein DYB38_007728 [Aphanomyces astaci]RHZ27308.1 hypothetical protein DYB31_009903 [Aphanomyces astaci]